MNTIRERIPDAGLIRFVTEGHITTEIKVGMGPFPAPIRQDALVSHIIALTKELAELGDNKVRSAAEDVVKCRYGGGSWDDLKAYIGVLGDALESSS